MYRLLKPKKNKDSEHDEEYDNEVNSDNDDNMNEEVEGSEIDDLCDEQFEVPEDCIFPGFFAFVAWGPFALPDDRLRFFNTADSKATKKVTRATMRNDKIVKTNIERNCSTSAIRGFSTNQRISIE